MSKKNEELKVGDLVKVNVMKYKGFRGTITKIDNGVATVEVKCYYNDQQSVVVHEDVRFLKVAEYKKKVKK